MSNLPFEMPVKDVSIHAEGIDATDWVLIDPEAKPKDGDNVLVSYSYILLPILSCRKRILNGHDNVRSYGDYHTKIKNTNSRRRILCRS